MLNSVSLFEFEVVTVDAKGKVVERQKRQAQYYREDLGDGVCLDLVVIPGGTFLMGAPTGEKDRSNDEGPQHQVTVPAFLMGKYPVTQAQHYKVMGDNPSYFKGENRPVESVTWHQAVEFCQRLSQQTGREYRLPSEAEWEYACRAGTMTPFHFGKTITTELANYRGTDMEYKGKTYSGKYGYGPHGIYRNQTTEVGSFPPNDFGLYDMHGNVWEWCQDVWHDNYQGAPTDGSAWNEEENQNLWFLSGSAWNERGNQNRRILRGGAWYSYPRNCRSACCYDDPAARTGGFRVCCCFDYAQTKAAP